MPVVSSCVKACDEFDLNVTTSGAPPPNPAMWRRAAAALDNVGTEAKLVLVGDSIAASFPRPLALEAFCKQSLHNLGVSGFRCQNVLWLLQAPAAAALRPTDVLLMVGTNNLSAGDKPCAIAAGVRAVVQQVTVLWDPRVIVLVQTVPRGPAEEFRRSDRKLLHRLVLDQHQETPSLLVVDADPVLDGEVRAFHPDQIHLLPYGYNRIADIVRGALHQHWQ